MFPGVSFAVLPKKAWEEKIFRREEEYKVRPIMVWGM